MSYIPAVTSWKSRARQSSPWAVPVHFMVDSRDSDKPPTDSGQRRGPQTLRCVQLFLDRFPHLREASERLLSDSEAFCELCEEYEACTQALQGGAKGYVIKHSAASAGLLTEYLALRLRLEGELLRCVSAHYAARDQG